MLNPALIAAKAASNGAVQKVPCIPVIPAPWLGGKMNKLVKGAPALLKSSTLMCAYMGQIKIQDDGMGGHDQVGSKGAKVASEKQESKSEGLKEENKSEDERNEKKSEKLDAFSNRTSKVKKSNVNKYKYSAKLENHFINGDGIGSKQRGVLGAHNEKSFNKTLENTGFPLEKLKIGEPIKHPKIDGIYSQKYTVPSYTAQDQHIGFKNIKDPKTIYDPSKISDDQMIKWGKEAMENGVIQSNGRIIEGCASNGLHFRGFLENGEISSFFPTLL